VRFLFYLLTLTMAVAQITSYGMYDIKLKANSRLRCSRACQETHFPFLGCSVIDGITVKADGNEYTRVFHYFRPEFTNNKPCVDSALVEVQLLTTCHELHSAGKCSEKRVRELCKQTCDQPDCFVVCPQNRCSMGHCPECKTLCGSPKCTTECGQNPHNCNAVCALPVCEWKCKIPECPKPECKMECEDKLDCSDKGDKAVKPMPDPSDGEWVASSAEAKING